MQTFMPYLSYLFDTNMLVNTLVNMSAEDKMIYAFTWTLRFLDSKRLGKQRIEALDIYRINSQCPCGTSDKHMALLTKKYSNHPIVKMWKGHEYALLLYGLTACDLWINCGYNDTTREKFANEILKYRFIDNIPRYPKWWHIEEIHLSHVCNLIRKNKNFYGPIYCNTNNECYAQQIQAMSSRPYIWYDVNLERCYWIDKERKMWVYL